VFFRRAVVHSSDVVHITIYNPVKLTKVDTAKNIIDIITGLMSTQAIE